MAWGINCTAPEHVTSAVRSIAQADSRPILVYPNIGQHWDAATRSWLGQAAGGLEHLVVEWLEMGVAGVGGCCGTGATDLRGLRELLA
jgi:homocysteine S-methyltransferase